MNTTPEHTERWADAQVSRRRATRMPYIPRGCDQQGRLRDGQRLQATACEQAEAAAAATDIGADQDNADEPLGLEGRWFAWGGLLAMALSLGGVAGAVGYVIARLAALAAQP